MTCYFKKDQIKLNVFDREHPGNPQSWRFLGIFRNKKKFSPSGTSQDWKINFLFCREMYCGWLSQRGKFSPAPFLRYCHFHLVYGHSSVSKKKLEIGKMGEDFILCSLRQEVGFFSGPF